LLKRSCDVLIAGVVLVLMTPVLALAVVAIATRLGFPVLFRQQRPGLHAVPFQLIKLRTMSDDRAPDGQHLSDSARLGALGRFLRRTSIDELPQLWNVVRGDMSLVGPRPLLMEYLDHYTPEQRRRHDVRPGITGWSQVRGRNLLEWSERFELDIWYIDHWSLWLDAKILLMTAWIVLTGRGVSQAGRATADKFKGTP
jgi:sugar transferase EpsL